MFWNTVYLSLLLPTVAFLSPTTLTPSCPEKCTCWATSYMVMCTGKFLERVPSGIPPETKSLVLYRNNIQKVEKDDFANLTSLLVLRLEHNFISRIHPNAFRDLGALKVLDLSNNHLTAITRKTFRTLTSISTLNLMNNSLDCSCHMIGLVQTSQQKHANLTGSCITNRWVVIPFEDMDSSNCVTASTFPVTSSWLISTLFRNIGTTETSFSVPGNIGSFIPSSATSTLPQVSSEMPASTPESYTSTTTSGLQRTAGSLTSPNYPNQYPHNLNRTWTIDAPLGDQIIINFDAFNTEEGFDVIYVRDMNGRDIEKLQGSLTVPYILSTGSNKVFLQFISDGSNAAKGFSLQWTAKRCSNSENTLIGAEGTLLSPNYPDGYPNNLNCTWTIETPFKFWDLTVEKFHTEQDHDFLYIRDGNFKDFARLHGDFLEPYQRVGYGVIHLIFSTDSGTTKSGFVLKWKEWYDTTTVPTTSTPTTTTRTTTIPIPTVPTTTYPTTTYPTTTYPTTTTPTTTTPTTTTRTTTTPSTTPTTTTRTTTTPSTTPTTTTPTTTTPTTITPTTFFPTTKYFVTTSPGESSTTCREIKQHCHKDAVCVQIGESVGCQCKSGYVGDGLYCSASKLCPDRRLLCSINADCGFSPLTFSHYCSCKPGYSGDGYTCSDVDECQKNSHLCHVNAECINSIGSYSCKCKDGYSGNGFSCSEGFPCLDPSLTCSLNGRCGFDVGLRKFHCACKPGFTGDGSTCADIDECKTGQASCDVHAMCTNTVGSFNCNCVDGYKGDGHMCEAKGKPCPDDNFTCSENARCVFEGRFRCLCKSGYVGNGQTCEDVDECKEKKDNCHYRAVCTNTVGSFKCSCLFGTLGDGITCV